MPLLSKALAILGQLQNPFVTAVTQIPLEPYSALSLRALCVSLSSSISIRGDGISFSSPQTESLDSTLNDLIQQILAVHSFRAGHDADIAVRLFLGRAHQPRERVPLQQERPFLGHYRINSTKVLETQRAVGPECQLLHHLCLFSSQRSRTKEGIVI